MKTLILTSSAIYKFEDENLGDLKAVFVFQFAWGKLPSPAKSAAYLGPRMRDQGPRQGEHWSDFASENLGDRHQAYLRSELTLTEFGRSILAHKQDFSWHNPIDRWWGGTRLTNRSFVALGSRSDRACEGVTA